MSNMLNVSSSPHLRSSHTTGREMYRDYFRGIPFRALYPARHPVQHCFLYGDGICVQHDHPQKELPDRLLRSCDRSSAGPGHSSVHPAVRPDPGRRLRYPGHQVLLRRTSIPLYAPILGGVFAILVTKCFFGGLGQNFMNPALAGRAFLLISFGKVMTDYSYDTVSGATPLAQLANGETIAMPWAISVSASAPC